MTCKDEPYIDLPSIFSFEMIVFSQFAQPPLAASPAPPVVTYLQRTVFQNKTTFSNIFALRNFKNRENNFAKKKMVVAHIFNILGSAHHTKEPVKPWRHKSPGVHIQLFDGVCVLQLD